MSAHSGQREDDVTLKSRWGTAHPEAALKGRTLWAATPAVWRGACKVDSPRPFRPTWRIKAYTECAIPYSVRDILNGGSTKNQNHFMLLGDRARNKFETNVKTKFEKELSEFKKLQEYYRKC